MSPKIQEIGPQRFRHALANSWEDRASFCEPVMTYRDRTGWLGRRDSNPCIPESKFAKTLSLGPSIGSIGRAIRGMALFERSSHVRRRRPDWLAGAAGFRTSASRNQIC